MKHNQLRQVVFPILAAFIWGTAFVAQDLCADVIDTFTFNAARSYIAVVVLLAMKTHKKKAVGGVKGKKVNHQREAVKVWCVCSERVY